MWIFHRMLGIEERDVLKQGGIHHSLNLKIQVYWDVTFCLLEITYQCYKASLHFQVVDQSTLNDIRKLEPSAL